MRASKLLNIKQFYQIYRLMEEYAELDVSEHTPGCTEISEGPEGESIDTECPICMERQTDIVFPCAHSFCQVCAQKWYVNRRTSESMTWSDGGWKGVAVL